jgi:sugar O-acyltransferase (sialic acid O-acetyltransferase NeuD family)
MNTPVTRTGYIGFGDLGRNIEGLVRADGLAHLTVAFDDKRYAEGAAGALPFADFERNEHADLRFFVCLGYLHLARKTEIVRRLLELGRQLPTFLHSTCFVSPSASVGSGSVVYPMSNIAHEAAVGRGVLVSNSVIVSHNSAIGDGCFLSAGVVVAGYVTVGRNTFIGAGSVISNGVRIGENVTIGIGTVVSKDVDDNCSVIGNPMRVLNRPLRLV